MCEEEELDDRKTGFRTTRIPSWDRQPSPSQMSKKEAQSSNSYFGFFEEKADADRARRDAAARKQKQREAEAAEKERAEQERQEREKKAKADEELRKQKLRQEAEEKAARERQEWYKAWENYEKRWAAFKGMRYFPPAISFDTSNADEFA
jgi:tyrosyl-tRNA synthetase